ncbi:MAG TPA: T9SS type A sorting domain-containing protein [Saprospiraceae bacterium]|nr:T9SS type A sorting domain-containing protein [Saprospiraceae bacterium]
MIFSFLGVALHCYSQKFYDYNWAFGYENDNIDTINIPDFGGQIMSFQNKKISFSRRVLKHDFDNQTNSLSDRSGSLKYMSNTCDILNSSGDIILNGDKLLLSKYNYCPKNDPSNQSGLFLVFENQDSILVFLHCIIDTINGSKNIFNKSIIEVKINTLRDSVLSKHKTILYDSLGAEGFCGIPTMTGDQYWIIIPEYENNGYWILLYGVDGVEKTIRHHEGLSSEKRASLTGQACFSPDGKHYALYNSVIGLQIFDFDRTNGSLSNYKYYGHKHEQLMFAGVCFSPDSRLLYFNTSVHMFQLELATNIIDTIASYEPYNDPYPTTFMHSALGPDCRIYTCTPGGNRYLHVILYPNRKGKACGFIQRGVKLLTRNGNAIPNFPHYRVNEPYPCDSTIALQLNTGVEGMDVESSGILFLYPNPVTEEMTVELRDKNQSIQQIKIYSSSGILCASQVYFSSSYSERMSLHSLSPGIYILECCDRSGLKYRQKFVKI